MRIIIALLAIIFSSEIKCMIVETQYGPILGKIETSVLGKDYFSFQKIPYMKPPLNELQFKDPQPPTNWTLPLDCTIEGPRFPQIDLTFEDFEEDKFKGSLDSMHINVFTTKLKPAVQNESLPVLVWIHGGGMNGFGVGSGTSELYGPDYFMEKDVVLVTFNYRLHVYGFLSLDDQSVGVPGNAGLKDQRMALKWVRDNIENFGGNNKNITVFGHSSGSGSIHYHLISESSKNLFQKSVLMSGTASDLHGIVPRKNWAFKLAKKLNYTGEEKDEDILKFLEKIEPYQIFKASSNLLTHDEKLNEHIFEAFGPTIEPYQTPNSFLLDFPENLYRNSWGNDVNILIGANSFENGLFINLINEFPFLVEEMSDFRTIMMTNFNRKFSEYDELKNAEKLKKTYYGMLEPSLTNIDGVVYFLNEQSFWYPIHRVVYQRLNSKGQTFVYKFDVSSMNNCFSKLKNMSQVYSKPIHMDEICYLFKTKFAEIHSPDSDERKKIDEMTDLLVNFAKYGKPNYKDWEEVKSDQKPLWGCKIKIDEKTCDEFEEAERMKIWDSIYSDSTTLTSSLILIILIISKTLLEL